MKPRLSSKQKKQLKGLLAKADHVFAIGRMDILEQICQQIDALSCLRGEPLSLSRCAGSRTQ